MSALSLPAGWAERTDATGTYYRRIIARTAHGGAS